MATSTHNLQLYNTLTREKAVFQPLDPKNVRLYVCGPTVYDFAHIGNARPVIVFDVLFRLLRHLYGKTHVTYVRNITDVDDKINARALRDFPDLPLNDAIAKVTKKTADQFHADVAALGCLEPTHEPRATDNIPQMQDMIKALIAKGHAYEAAGEVLFDTASMADYGQLSNRNLAEQQAGARVEVEDHKRNAADFVLWKGSSETEPGWDSPWGRGRPGWHIECSAMSNRYLWDQVVDELSDEARAHVHQFDIHGGGLDLIFPHHENEIAQSRCAHESAAMARVWMHNGFLQVEGEKMSKSLGNFITIHELLESDTFGGRKWPGEVLRLAMLDTNYREPLDFTVRKLEVAATVLERWYRLIGDTEPSETSDFEIEIAMQSLCNDLNTHDAISRLSAMSDIVRDEPKVAGRFKKAANLLGLLQYTQSQWDGFKRGDVTLSDDEILEQIAARQAARKAKDWAEGDRIRDELLKMGIQLKDAKNPETGEIETTWEVKR